MHIYNLVCPVCYNLWREFESLITDTSCSVDVWVVDWSQEAHFGGLKWVSTTENWLFCLNKKSEMFTSHKYYLSGIFISREKTPPSYGVPEPPTISVNHKGENMLN